MRLDIGSGPTIDEPNDETIERAIRALLDEKKGGVAILIESGEPNNYIQAVELGPTFGVEYRDSTIQRHFRMENVPVETVITLFQLYRRGEGSWRKDFPWNDVTAEYEWDGRGATGAASGPSAGGVYLLKAGPYYKIGKSINFEQRISQIRLQLPYPVEVIHRILTDDVTGIESYWHKRFADKRTNGEWFLLTDEDVAIFKSRNHM